MLYILGGAPRAGKSIIARKFAKERGIPYFSTDYLITSLQNGSSELGIKHGQPFIPKAKRLWSFVKPLLEGFVKEVDEYLFEGDGILPIQVNEILKKFPRRIKACFLGFTKISKAKKLALIRGHEHLPDEWTSKYLDNEVEKMVDSMFEFSKYLKEECDKYSIPYIEIGNDLPEVQREVESIFFNSSKQ